MLIITPFTQREIATVFSLPLTGIQSETYFEENVVAHLMKINSAPKNPGVQLNRTRCTNVIDNGQLGNCCHFFKRLPLPGGKPGIFLF